MHVVTAGMHDPFIQGPDLQFRIFPDGQGIHIRPQSYPLTRLPAPDDGQNTRLYIGKAVFNTPSIQAPSNESRGFVFLKGQFRMAVQVPPDIPDFFQESGRQQS
jgi:hypothetical protein